MISKIISKIYIIISIFKLNIKYGNKFIIGNGVNFRSKFNIRISLNGYLKIGKGCFFNRGFSLTSFIGVTIGDDCIFGENVSIYDHNHRFNSKCLIKEQGFTYGNVIIGDNCWIGSNVTILKGVTIGDNVVIGANCVISESIPSNSIVRCNQALDIQQIAFRES